MTGHTRRLAALLAALFSLFLLAGCQSGGDGTPSTQPSAEVTPEPTPSPTPDPNEAVRTYWSEAQLTQAWGPNQIVEHLFFHPIIAYPELAFDGDNMEEGLDDWMVTVDEYNKILQSLYDNNYILVDINSVWSEQTNENGETRMVRNTLMLPEGKKPLIISFDDVNYYDYMRQNGMVYKLIIGDDGEIWSWGLDPQGNEVISQELDIITNLTAFVRAHPDFSLNGAMGCIGLTGYEGILGYRTQTDTENTSAAFEANRQAEIEAVKPVIAKLKEDGYTFASHTWGHIRLESKGLSSVQKDTQRWMDEVASLVGPTQVLLYPYGSRPDGGKENGECFAYLQSMGFRILPAVGIESYQKIRSDTAAVVCDRMHPDGTTLRSSKARERYMKFYDAKDIIDLTVRPQREVGWL